MRRIAEACAEGIGKGGTHRCGVPGRQLDRIVAVGETHEQQGFVRDRYVGCKIAARLSDEFGLRAVQRFDAARTERQRERTLADRRRPRKAHAIGR